MKPHHTICDHCEVACTIHYDDQTTEEIPSYCPFCGEYISEHNEEPPSLRGFDFDEDVEL